MKIENILRSIVIGGVFLTLLTPLIVVGDMFFPYITGKAFFFRTLVEIMGAAWLVLLYVNPIYRPKKSLIVASVGVFAAIIALADIFGANSTASIWSNYERMEGLVGFSHIVLYFLILVTTLSTERLWTRFFQASLLVGALVNFMAVKEFAGAEGAVRLAATLGNPTYLAVYALVHFFISAFLLVRARVRWEQVVYAAVGLLNVFILYYTATRGALLGLIGGIFLASVLVTLLGKYSHPSLWKGAVGISIGTLLIVGGFFTIKDTTFVQESPVLSRFASISLDEKTTRSRLMVWDMAWQGFKERPAFGWGQENFLEVFNKYYNPKMYDQEPWFDRAHNVFFDWLVAGGALGLLGYLALFVLAIFVLWRRTPFSVVEKSILTGLFAGYFVHNLFVFDHLVSYILFFSLLAFLGHYEREKYVEKFEKAKGVNAPYATVVLTGAIALLFFGGYFLNYKAFAGNFALLEGLKPHETQNGRDWGKNLDAFKKALVYTDGGLGALEVKEHLTRTTVAAISSPTPASQEVQTEFVTLTLAELQKEVDRAPDNILARIFLGTFLQEIGRPDEAIPQFLKAHELSPKKPDILIQFGSVYLDKKDYKKAMEIFKQAYELETSYPQAKQAYAVAAVYAGDEKMAKDLYGGEIPADPSFADAYVTRKEYRKAVAIWERIVEENPNNSQYRLLLGANYLTIGRSDLAMQQLEKAAELNPELKGQVEFYLQQIRAGKVSF